MSIANRKEFELRAKRLIENNAQVKELGKVVSSDKEAIKDYMTENRLELFEGDGNTSVKVSTSVSSSIDSEKLLALLNTLMEEAPSEELCEKISECIEYVPKINEDKVMSLVYEDLIDKEDIEKITVQKETVKMYIK